MKLPRTTPSSVWGLKTVVDRYEWKNTNDSNMIEIAISKASRRTVKIGEREPITLQGKNFMCIIGDNDVSAYADDGVSVDIVSVAARFEAIEYVFTDFSGTDLEETESLLLPFTLSDLPMQDWLNIENLLYRYTSEHIKQDAASEMICASLIYELFAVLDRIVRKHLKAKSKKYVNYYVLKADAILEERYWERLTLRSMAEELGITPNYLSFMYKNCLGIGFSDRLCELRMNRAKDLILRGNLSISDIAHAVGFDDESHLRRRFKQFFGISIKEYRLVNKEQTLYHEKPQRKGSIDHTVPEK